MNIEQELHKHLFQQREEQTQHLEYNLEFQFYNACLLYTSPSPRD